jgi:XapX domain-containing protein
VERRYRKVPQVTGLQALALGILIGLTFGLVRLPVPAPPTLAGVLGVVGISAGWNLALWIAERV